MTPLRNASSTASQQIELGSLPEWNLADLYPGIDSEAFKADLGKAETECKAFADAYRGKLDAIARAENAPEVMFAALKRYEGVEDLSGTTHVLRGPHLCRRHH